MEALPTTLDQWVGWFTVLGFGFAFTVLTTGITAFESSMLGKGGVGKTSEEFSTAGRNLGMGLVFLKFKIRIWHVTCIPSSSLEAKFTTKGGEKSQQNFKTNSKT